MLACVFAVLASARNFREIGNQVGSTIWLSGWTATVRPAEFRQTPPVSANDDLDAMIGGQRGHCFDPVEDLLFGVLDVAVAAVDRGTTPVVVNAARVGA